MTIGHIDITIRCYLSIDVKKEEAQEIVDSMEYEIDHDLIDSTDLFHYETPED